MTTPKALALAFSSLGSRCSPKLVKPHRTFDWNKDFFLELPHCSTIRGLPNSLVTPYSSLFNLSRSHKLAQRQWLHSNGFPVPETCGVNLSSHQEGDQYVVRPLRHFQGRNYRLTSDPTDYQPGCEYLSKVWPKHWEYRILMCRGEPVVTLLKQRPETLDHSQPWNHANGSRFVTVENQELNRLRHTDVYQRLTGSTTLSCADLLAVDIMVNKSRGQEFAYVICEVNFSPSVSIPSNTIKVVQHANCRYC